MEIGVVTVKEIEQWRAQLGAKTLTLARCLTAGYNVPAFVAIPATASKKLLADSGWRQKIALEADMNLHSALYAVRSSALIEDGKQQSLAGQFLTKVNISPADLSEALLAVITQANIFLDGAVDQFSIIIQTYIPADVAGVTFTRNPTGGREMILEYAQGTGENIVGGVIRPQQLALYWHDDPTRLKPPLPLATKIISTCQKLEQHFDFPQDIEWCIKDKQFFVLQTRPISTITDQQYKAIQLLESTLPCHTKFYYEKTELSEIAPRPARLTLDLLEQLYAKHGPIKQVYQTYGLTYDSTHFLKIIGNELYIDKEQELKGLLPAYNYFNNAECIPRLASVNGLWVTVKNIWRLNRIPTKNYDVLFKLLQTKLIQPLADTTDLSTALAVFLEDYKTIFEVNLLAGLITKQINFLLKHEPITFTTILAAGQQFIDLKQYQINPPTAVMGNSLDLMDTSPFVATPLVLTNDNTLIQQWWNTLSTYKKTAFKNKLAAGIAFHRLREYGRWLTVKHTTVLRKKLLEYAEKKHWPDPTAIWFAQFAELLQDKVTAADCLARKNNYLAYNTFTCPTSLTSSLIQKTTPTIGISAGRSTGQLWDAAHLDSGNQADKAIILYAPMLTPQLTKYFSKIKGIVSTNGGMLSHLAIIAREQHLPVVVNFSLEKNSIALGDTITIDGTTGEMYLDKVV